ncbi:hypothetical protein EA658_20350 [Pseudoxanthomonas winnipegensis]|uniref:DUF7352 domain-containing protein n=1 Tax=Pseudoxanthomonas winnipegensis TaxID=2480810 RepID=A0ABY1W8X7_9GAMM|nr:hypothetical protein [Pseudoxanthomonas winnipegensis]TAA08228.1 hypothetical protein EA659_16230 [Pseudoxanthomonas winnipegensis]TAA16238.1 hypothetical protein EA658_20350 [Pseudoxanthomonas winnipegensis]TAH72689.1 hypothetical protein EA657_10655 [Pseudoxanthomonas winnipegensis]
MPRVIAKYNLAIVPEQIIEMSVATTILGLSIQDDQLQVVVDQEGAAPRTAKRSFFIVRGGAEPIPDQALNYVGQFSIDGAWAYLFTDTGDMPSGFVPDAPLATWADIHSIHERLAALQNAVTALAAAR